MLLQYDPERPAGCGRFKRMERPALPHVEAWYRRLTERPGYRAHVMQPFDHLRGRSSF